MVGPRIIDSDGHVNEDIEAMQRYLPSPHRDYAGKFLSNLFPPLDHFHAGHLVMVPREILNRGRVGPDGWLEFLDDVGIESTVLYPTVALGYGKITSLDWMQVATCAYNDWLYETYIKRSPRFQGVGLLPLRDPEAAARELRRIVKEQGIQIFIGCEGDEPELGAAIKVVGNKPFVYSSDFPHEVTAGSCKHEIEELLDNEELNDDDKNAILYGNAERFYRVKVPVA